MKGRVYIFASGKMISVGTKSEKEAAYELECAKEFLVEKGFIEPTVLEPKVQNIVVMVDFGESINLEELAKNYKIVYETEQFAGGILRIKEPYKATVLLFASGKAVITGLKSSSHTGPIIQKIITMMNIS